MTDPTARSGYLYGLIAYTCWGLVPLYFAQVKHVPAGEILAHRILWSIGLMAILTAITGTRRELVRVLTTRRLVLTMLLSGSLLAINWLLYIYATVSGNVAEASLGYYMMPLVHSFLAAVVLGEKLRPAHYPALALVAVGVMIPFVATGKFTVLAVALPVTFGLYGLVKKMAPIDSLTGLSAETILLAAPSAAFLAYQASVGAGQFGREVPVSLLLMFGGVVTVVPLLTYTLSLRRLPLLAVNLIQFLSPTLQLVVAVTILGEVVGWEKWAAIGCVIVSALIFIADAVYKAKFSGPATGRTRTAVGGPAKPVLVPLPSGAPRP